MKVLFSKLILIILFPKFPFHQVDQRDFPEVTVNGRPFKEKRISEAVITNKF